MRSPDTPGLAPAASIAPLWRRLAAGLVDLAVLAPALLALSWIWARVFELELPTERLPLFDWLVQLYLRDDPLVLGGALFLAGASALWFLVMPLLTGVTPGLRLLGLCLVEADGSTVGPAAAAVRALGAVLSAAYLGLGFLWILFDPERRGFHDKIAGTWVVRRNAR